MRRDVTRKAPGGLPINLGIRSHPRWPSLSLAAMLGGLLLLALLLAQGARAASHTAVLESLTLSGVPEMDFQADMTEYTATVLDAASTTVMAVAADTAPADDPATVTITPDDADADMDNHQVDLAIGETEITVTVTRESAAKIYTVTVTRIAANDVSLTALSLSGDAELSPKFAGDVTAYTASVPNDLNAMDLVVQNLITVTARPVMGASIGLITPGTLAPAGNDGSRATPWSICRSVTPSSR